jgi:high-affinity nickel permease
MFGLDNSIAGLSDGSALLVVVAVAILLGLRHASDPDHLAAVTTLLASKKERGLRSAASLGFTWGLGHATSLFAFGVPIVLYKAYLPEAVQSGAETGIGLMIMALAVWLLVRWRRGAFAVHAHDGAPHSHSRGHRHPRRSRSPLQAYAIGVLHGVGGSAGVGVLVLASISDRLLAVVALGLFAFFTAVSMALLSSGFGLTLSRPRVQRSFARFAPALGALSLAFGVWYTLGAQSVVPYVF